MYTHAQSITGDPNMAHQLLTCSKENFVELEQYVMYTLKDLAGCRDEAGKPSMLGTDEHRPNFGQLTLLKATVMLTDRMLDFGFFLSRASFADLTSISTSVYSILDCNDLLDNDRQGRLHNEVRLQALRLLERTMDVRLNHRISIVMQTWEKIWQDHHGAVDDRVMLREHAADLEDKLFGENIVSAPDISADTYKPDGWRKDGGDKSVDLLLKLCRQHVAIRNKALPLLMRHLTQKSALFRQVLAKELPE